MRFYRITLSKRAASHWCPPDPLAATGEEIDARLFTEAAQYEDAGAVTLPPTEGHPAHFALGSFLYPVVDRQTLDVLASMDDQVQGIPMSMPHGEYWIANALRSVACIDEEASEFQRF